MQYPYYHRIFNVVSFKEFETIRKIYSTEDVEISCENEKIIFISKNEKGLRHANSLSLQLSGFLYLLRNLKSYE